MRDFLRTPGGEPLKHFRAEWSAQGFVQPNFTNIFQEYLPRSGASLVAQLVRNLPAMQETWV